MAGIGSRRRTINDKSREQLECMHVFGLHAEMMILGQQEAIKIDTQRAKTLFKVALHGS